MRREEVECMHGIRAVNCSNCAGQVDHLLELENAPDCKCIEEDSICEGCSELPNSLEPARALDLPDEAFRLEIAAGDRPTPGFIHHDARALGDIEIVADARDELVRLVGPERCSEVRATHILEHFPYGETVNVLKLWVKLLVPSGQLYVEVPNLGWQIRACADGHITAEEFVYYCFGGQDYEGNTHFAGFDSELLKTRLEQSGLVDVHVTDIGQVLVATGTKPG